MNGKEKTAFRETTFREIFDAAGLQTLGFKYKKGIFVRTDGAFTDTISYGSSRYSNQSDDYNLMVIHAGTTHTGFAKFQHEILDETYLSGSIGSAHLENLYTDGPPYISYDIGISAVTQQPAVARIAGAIRNSCLPFFALCRDIEEVAANIHLPAFSPVYRVIEYFLFSSRTDLIDVALQNLINRTPEMQSLLAEYAEKVKTEGIPENVFPGTSGNKDRVTAANMAIRLKELQLKGLPVTSVFCPY